jgi:hypothetical protein
MAFIMVLTLHLQPSELVAAVERSIGGSTVTCEETG